MSKGQKISAIPVVFSIVLLLLAVCFSEDISDGFYTFLRLSVFVTCLYLSINFLALARPIWAWGMIFVCLLFNPIIVVELEADTWILMDILCIAFLGIALIPETWKLRIQSFIKRNLLRLVVGSIFMIGICSLIVILNARIEENKSEALKKVHEKQEQEQRMLLKQKAEERQRGNFEDNQKYCSGFKVVNALTGQAQGLEGIERADIVKESSWCVIFPRDMKEAERENILLQKFVKERVRYNDGKILVELEKVEQRGDKIFIHVSFESLMENKVLYFRSPAFLHAEDNFGNLYSFVDLFFSLNDQERTYYTGSNTFKDGSWHYKDRGTKVWFTEELPINNATEFILRMSFEYDLELKQVTFKFPRSYIADLRQQRTAT